MSYLTQCIWHEPHIGEGRAQSIEEVLREGTTKRHGASTDKHESVAWVRQFLVDGQVRFGGVHASCGDQSVQGAGRLQMLADSGHIGALVGVDGVVKFGRIFASCFAMWRHFQFIEPGFMAEFRDDVQVMIGLEQSVAPGALLVYDRLGGVVC